VVQRHLKQLKAENVPGRQLVAVVDLPRLARDRRDSQGTFLVIPVGNTE